MSPTGPFSGPQQLPRILPETPREHMEGGSGGLSAKPSHNYHENVASFPQNQYFGILLSSFSYTFGSIFGSFWHHSGIILVLIFIHFASFANQFEGPSRVLFRSSCNHVGNILHYFWDHFGIRWKEGLGGSQRNNAKTITKMLQALPEIIIF